MARKRPLLIFVLMLLVARSAHSQTSASLPAAPVSATQPSREEPSRAMAAVGTVGAVMLVSGYVVGAGFGAILLGVGYDSPSPANAFVPVAGPFLMGASHPLWLVDGVTQVTGAAMLTSFLVYSATRAPPPVRNEALALMRGVKVIPSLVGFRGAAVSLVF